MSPRKPTAKSIKATLAKHTPKKAPAILIEDACAAPGCIAPPEVQVGKARYCAKHGAKAEAHLPQQPKAAAATAAAAYSVGQTVEVHAFGHWYVGGVVKLGRKNVRVRYTTGSGAIRTKSVGLDKVRALAAVDHAAVAQAAAQVAAKLRPELAPAKQPKATKATKATKAKRADKAPKESGVIATAKGDAPAIIAQLRAKGWSDEKIGMAMGVSATCRRSTVWAWRTGRRECPAQLELGSLLLLDAPRPDVVRPVPAAGSLRVREEKAARVNASRLADPRQLVLALNGLRDAIDEVLAGGRK